MAAGTGYGAGGVGVLQVRVGDKNARAIIDVLMLYTPAAEAAAGGGAQILSIVSQIIMPLGICFVIQQTGTLQPLHIWIAILIGHATRCALSVLRFNQGRWRDIKVDVSHPTRR